MRGEEKIQIVESLYDGLAIGETEKVAALLAADLEWWFHGPPRSQHMMRVLTGATSKETEVEFRFKPKKVVEVGKWVVAEGWEGDRTYWVHLWAVDGGIITQFREYFDTWLTVRELGLKAQPTTGWACRTTAPTFWQSEMQGHLGRSLPGLVLVI